MNRYVVASLTVLMLGLPSAKAAEPQPASVEMSLPPSISVSGTGQVFARPDMAEINLGVTTQASTAKAALAANNSAMANLMTTLTTAGIEEKDILTSNFNVNPEYRHDNPDAAYGRPPRIVGYRVDNSVQVKVRKLDLLGNLLDAVVSSGANNINGIGFTVSKPEPLLDKARTLAVADARRKAELYAQGAGVKVGKVLYINETTVNMPVPTTRMAAMEQAVSSVPIASGEQRLDATVGVVFTIEP